MQRVTGRGMKSSVIERHVNYQSHIVKQQTAGKVHLGFLGEKRRTCGNLNLFVLKKKLSLSKNYVLKSRILQK